MLVRVHKQLERRLVETSFFPVVYVLWDSLECVIFFKVHQGRR